MQNNDSINTLIQMVEELKTKKKYLILPKERNIYDNLIRIIEDYVNEPNEEKNPYIDNMDDKPNNIEVPKQKPQEKSNTEIKYREPDRNYEVHVRKQPNIIQNGESKIDEENSSNSESEKSPKRKNEVENDKKKKKKKKEKDFDEDYIEEPKITENVEEIEETNEEDKQENLEVKKKEKKPRGPQKCKKCKEMKKDNHFLITLCKNNRDHMNIYESFNSANEN